MDNLLRYAYIERRCNACGGTYRVTLHDAVMQHRLHDDWQSARHCATCADEMTPILSSLPAESLENLESAWEEVSKAAKDAGLELRFGA